jgi:hypothetical protein
MLLLRGGGRSFVRKAQAHNDHRITGKQVMGEPLSKWDEARKQLNDKQKYALFSFGNRGR